ncbi:FAD-dependent oxidoreductase [Ktedonobacter sp. SOSP1-52]|uniref:FAD-dependent oxidoreductase n=1 Tax=Ktedonobacter sp. SOSP1-52 TaxID=2778366 RepID=UPI0019164499
MSRGEDVNIGGGIIGCSIAYFLRTQGVDVSVLEKGYLGAQASSAAVGLLAPIRPLTQLDAYKALLLAGMKRFPLTLPLLKQGGFFLHPGDNGRSYLLSTSSA